MPAASQTSAHSSLFSSLRHVFHSTSQQYASAAVPDSSPLSTPSRPSSSPIDHQIYQAFELNLSQRLSSLYPVDDCPCASISSLNQFLHVLLATQADVSTLVPAHQYPLSQPRVGMMTEFLERSVKILDVCRVIKEQISGVESMQGVLHAVLSCLSTKNGAELDVAQIHRAQKMLAELILLMEVERGEDPALCPNRSFQSRGRGNGAGAESVRERPRRWRSWHGRGLMTAAPLVSSLSDWSPSRQLQGLLSTLALPNMPAGDVEDLFCAAMYALNVLSIVFLGTIYASLPSLERVFVPSFVPLRSVSWAPPLLRLQERVQKEVKCRSKTSNSYAGMWELDQIATIVRKLFDLTEDHDSTVGEKIGDEIKNLVKQLKHHVEELYRDLGRLYSQLMDFYNSIISSRMDVLDKLSSLRA